MPTETPVFAQHPDTLIKKSDKILPAVALEPAAPSPEAVAADEVTLEQLKKELPDLLFGEQKKVAAASPEKAAEDAAKAKAEADAKIVADAKIAEDAAKAAAEKKTTIRKAPDALEIARETGKAIAESIRSGTQVEAELVVDAAPTDPTVNLSPEDKENYELFQTLSDSDPAKYKNKHVEFLSFVKKAKNYQTRWEKENAGKAYDPSDSEHEDFYSANQPQFVEADLERAKVRREVRKEVEASMVEQNKASERRMRELEEKTVVPEVNRQAASISDAAVNRFVAAIPDEDLRKAATETLDKLPETDPLAYEVLNGEAANLRREVSELHSIIHRRDYFNAANPVHTQLSGFINNQEQIIKKLPADKQVFDGKTFATRQEWAAMTPTQRQNRWMLGEEDVVEMLTKTSANRAVKVIESERARLEAQAIKYGYTKPASAATPKPAVAAATPPPAAPAAAAKRPSGPSGSEGGALPPTTTPANRNETTEKNLVKFLF